VLYHRLFSSQKADFVSEPAEVPQMLHMVSQVVADLKTLMTVTWVLDRGFFDDIAVWRTIWNRGSAWSVASSTRNGSSNIG